MTYSHAPAYATALSASRAVDRTRHLIQRDSEAPHWPACAALGWDLAPGLLRALALGHGWPTMVRCLDEIRRQSEAVPPL